MCIMYSINALKELHKFHSNQSSDVGHIAEELMNTCYRTYFPPYRFGYFVDTDK